MTFIKYPSTPHLLWLSQTPPRNDKVLSAAEAEFLLRDRVTVEEKIDGANIGLSLGRDDQIQVQNRGGYLERPFGGQFSRLNGWLREHEDVLANLLRGRIFFGEWCAAQHSIHYDKLPDWFLLFDVFDLKEEKFWSTERRIRVASEAGLASVPILSQGHWTCAGLVDLVAASTSSFSKYMLEGVVIRRDGTNWNEGKAKLVRAEFVQGMEKHWKQRRLIWNRVAY